MGALRGLKDTRFPMLISLLSYWGIGMATGWPTTPRSRDVDETG